MWSLAKNLLRKVAPAAISWGINKLAGTNIGRNHIMPIIASD